VQKPGTASTVGTYDHVRLLQHLWSAPHETSHGMLGVMFLQALRTCLTSSSSARCLPARSILSSSAKRLRSEAEVALAWCSRTRIVQSVVVGACKHTKETAAAAALLARLAWCATRQANPP
jgi:hypothetical protein